MGLLLALAAGASLLTLMLYYWLVAHFMQGQSPLANAEYIMDIHTVSARIAAVLHLVAGGALFLVLYRGLRGVPLEKLRGWAWHHRWIGWGAALVTGLTVTLWLTGVLRGAPSSEDDLTYFFQARLFANGQTMLPTAQWGPLAQGLEWWWTIPGTRGICSFQVPGHSLLLVPGAWLGQFSLVPAAEAVVTGLATYRAALLLFGRRTAALTAILFATSPYVYTTFSGYSASTSTACMVSLALWAWAALLHKATARRAFVLGVCIGLVCWIRPAAALFVSVPMAAWLLVCMVRGVSSWRLAPAGLAGVIPLVALYIGYCTYVSGRPAFTPGSVYAERLGSGELSPENVIQAPPRQAIHLPGTLIGLARLNIYLHGWPLSLLPLLVLPLLPGKGARTWVLIVPVVSVLCFYAFYRAVTGWYYFEVAPLMYILSARSVVLMRAWVRRRQRPFLIRALPRLVCAGVILSCVQSIPLAMARQHDYVQVFNNVHEEVFERLAGRPAAILMAPDEWSRWGAYLTGRNSPFLDDEVVYVNASGGHWDRRQLEAVVGRREFYYLRIDDPPQESLTLERVWESAGLIWLGWPVGFA